ncbi:TPA: hypothetical protein EYP70_00845 [Candidatus Bathyarchaeota archaeon]|nr:hypothetical protein [Candidatus Bathyarchaeota archaeon]
MDPIAKRYFFVKNPVRLLIENVPDNFVAKIPFHPDRPTLGFRKLKIETTDGKAYVLISDSDLHLFKKGSLIRLIGLFNLRIDSAVNRDNVKGVFLSVRHEDAKRLGAHLIHWVPEKENFTCKVIMPDGLTVQGKVERNIQGEKKNSIVQFERFGFARVDKVDPPFILFYTHK